MPASHDAVTAARFEVTIDGYQIAHFAELWITAASGASRSVQGHELSHVIQQGPGAAPLKWPPLVLKKGVISSSALTRLRYNGPVAGAALVATDSAGRATVRYPLPNLVAIRHSAPKPKGGGMVAMEEIVLQVEGSA